VIIIFLLPESAPRSGAIGISGLVLKELDKDQQVGVRGRALGNEMKVIRHKAIRRDKESSTRRFFCQETKQPIAEPGNSEGWIPVSTADREEVSLLAYVLSRGQADVPVVRNLGHLIYMLIPCRVYIRFVANQELPHAKLRRAAATRFVADWGSCCPVGLWRLAVEW
jgi:hypothetical protein